MAADVSRVRSPRGGPARGAAHARERLPGRPGCAVGVPRRRGALPRRVRRRLLQPSRLDDRRRPARGREHRQSAELGGRDVPDRRRGVVLPRWRRRRRSPPCGSGRPGRPVAAGDGAGRRGGTPDAVAAASPRVDGGPASRGGRHAAAAGELVRPADHPVDAGRDRPEHERPGSGPVRGSASDRGDDGAVGHGCGVAACGDQPVPSPYRAGGPHAGAGGRDVRGGRPAPLFSKRTPLPTRSP